MKAKLTHLVLAQSLFVCLFVLPAQADTYLCAKKVAKVSDGKLKLARSIASSSGACTSRYRQIYQQSGTSLLSDISTVDGVGSGLDADTLDGLSSADFELASDASALTTRVSALESQTQDPRVLRVSATGGDYTSLSTAISSISDATIANPYLVIVGPGIFSLSSPITIPSGVHVRGSGMHTTTVTSTHSATPISAGCLINLSDGASLSQIGVYSTASTLFSAGVCASSISASNVADPASFQTRIDHVLIDVTGAGGTAHYGIYSTNADIRISNAHISTANALTNYGIYSLGNEASKVSRVTNTTIHTDTNSSYGILTSGSAQIFYIDGSNIYSNSVALYASTSDIYVTHSTLSSSASYVMYASGASATIIANQIQIDGPLNAGSTGGGAVTCSFVSELTSGTGHASTCS